MIFGQVDQSGVVVVLEYFAMPASLDRDLHDTLRLGGVQAFAQQPQEGLLGQFTRRFLIEAVAAVRHKRNAREQLSAEDRLSCGRRR